MTALLIIAFCIALAIAYARPSWAMIGLGAALPTYVVRGHIFSVPTTLLEMLVLGVVCGVVIRKRRQRPREYDVFMLYGLSFLYITTLACVAAPALAPAAGIWKAYCLEPVLVASCAILALRDAESWNKLWVAMLCSGVVISIMCIVQYFTHVGIPSPWNVTGNIRTTALYGYPNAVGLFLAPLTALCLAWCAQYKKTRVLTSITALLFITAILLSRSDGALASIAVVIFVLLIVYRRFLIAGACIIAGVLAAVLSSTVRDIITLHDTSGDVRRALWHGTMNLLTHQPVWGAGLANFPYAYDQYRLPSHVELLEYAHNIFLDFWAQFGAAGVLWLCAVLIALIVYIIKTKKRSWSLIAMAIAILVYGFVDVPYFKNDLAILCWLLIANFFWSAKKEK